MEKNNTRLFYIAIFFWALVHLIFFQTFIFHDSWKHMFPLYYSFVNQGSCLEIPSWLGTVDNGSPMLIYLISTSLTQITQIPYFFTMECLKPGVTASIYSFKFQIYLTYLIFSISIYVLGRNIFTYRSSALFLFTACLFSGIGLDHAHSNQIVSIIFWYPWIIVSAVLFIKSKNFRKKLIWWTFLCIFISAQALDQYPHFVATILFLASITFVVPYFFINKIQIRWIDFLKLLIPATIILGVTLFELLVIKGAIEGYQPSLRSGLVIAPQQFGETGFLQPTALLASFLPLSFMYDFDNLRQALGSILFNFGVKNGDSGFIFKLDALLMVCGISIVLFAIFFIFCVKSKGDKRIRNSLAAFILLVTAISMQQTKLYFVIFEIPFFNLFRSYFLFTPFIILGVMILGGYGFDRFQSADIKIRQQAAKKTCLTIILLVLIALIIFIFLYLKSSNNKNYLITSFFLLLDLGLIYISIFTFYEVSKVGILGSGVQKIIVINCIILIVLTSFLYALTGISSDDLLKKYQIDKNLSPSNSKMFTGNDRISCNSFVQCYVNSSPTVSASLDLNGTFLRNKYEPIFYIDRIGEKSWKLFSGIDGQSSWITSNIISKEMVSKDIMSDYSNLQLKDSKLSKDGLFDKYQEIKSKTGKVEIKKWRGRFIHLNYQASTPSSIFLALSYDQAWNAQRSIDSLLLKTLPAYIGGTSIEVPAGSGEIVLEYKNVASTSVFILRYLTMFISLLGLIGISIKSLKD